MKTRTLEIGSRPGQNPSTMEKPKNFSSDRNSRKTSNTFDQDNSPSDRPATQTTMLLNTKEYVLQFIQSMIN